MRPKQYTEALTLVGLTKSGAAIFFGVSERQAFRWVKQGPPNPVALMLELMCCQGFRATDVMHLVTYYRNVRSAAKKTAKSSRS